MTPVENSNSITDADTDSEIRTDLSSGIRIDTSTETSADTGINSAPNSAPNQEKVLLEQCVNYFKGSKGFQRLLERILAKYRSLGHMGGTIVLQNLTTVEKESLTGLLRKDLSKQKSLSVKIETIQKCLEQTRFRGLGLEDVLQAYFGIELQSKEEARRNYEFTRKKFFLKLIDEYRETPGGQWLEDVCLSKESVYRTLIQRYDCHCQRKKLQQDLDNVCRAMNNLPGTGEEKQRLPVFASLITKNPHAFDGETACGKLLVAALVHKLQAKKPENAEERAELYYQAGILIDEVSNYVLCYGLRAFTETRLSAEDRVHAGWEGFYRTGEPLMVTLANISHLERAISPSGKVFVFENPGVFTAVLDHLQEETQTQTQHQKPALICTYGQLKIAALTLLDMLAAEGTLIYYSGDFDPEGLLIADRLCTRYGDKLRLWRYTQQDYEKAISAKVLDEVRLKKLDSLKNESLIVLAQRIKQGRLAGYQELLLDELRKDLL